MVTHLYDVNDISFVKYRLYYIINWLENKNYRAICVLILNPGCPAAMFVESRSKYFHEIIIIIVSMIFV